MNKLPRGPRIKFTTIDTNSAGLSVLLALLQAYILYEMNGSLRDMILKGHENLISWAMIFSPTLGLVAVLKKFAGSSPSNPQEPPDMPNPIDEIVEDK